MNDRKANTQRVQTKHIMTAAKYHNHLHVSTGVKTGRMTESSTEHNLDLWPLGVLGCWPDGLELTPGLYLGSNEQHRLF